ncbi:hypothetical protein [Frigidibacter sp.]|uniref:hypothetical protein n=1 Tax=Frigidibacter sp. TaxID=2586418 RepID=UPI002734435B|nr:hypothetical protein [Frigidibacter sp.]MDP3342229.1 hypothetical protein [Frigidibacter sp.]
MNKTNSSAHFFFDWAKARIDEMDATLTSLEGKSGAMQAETRAKADRFIADLKEKREEFDRKVKTQTEAADDALDVAQARLEADWKGFQTETSKYLETFGTGIGEQQAVFQSQASAQMNAWRETADKLNAAGKEFAVERRREIEEQVARMKADAGAAETKLAELAKAGTESWNALNAALAETRASFDLAHKAAREAFDRATGRDADK